MFADTHCHICPGLDDGARDMDEALEMCRIAWNEGVRSIAVTAHQNDRWPDVTPARIERATQELAGRLEDMDCSLQLVPAAEVMIGANTMEYWRAGRLLSVGNQGKYLLVEFPHGLHLDIRDLAREFVDQGLRPILAHAERCPELAYVPGKIEELIEIGCMVQISTGAIANPENRRQQKILRDWARRGIIHVVGSDAHSPRRRRPNMISAFQQLKKWTSHSLAKRICGTNGMAVLNGRSMQLALSNRPPRRWFSFGR